MAENVIFLINLQILRTEKLFFPYDATHHKKTDSLQFPCLQMTAFTSIIHLQRSKRSCASDAKNFLVCAQSLFKESTGGLPQHGVKQSKK